MKKLSGAAAKWEDAILLLPRDDFNLNILVTEANLKKIGFLHPDVGSLPKLKFRGGFFVKNIGGEDQEIVIKDPPTSLVSFGGVPLGVSRFRRALEV